MCTISAKPFGTPLPTSPVFVVDPNHWGREACPFQPNIPNAIAQMDPRKVNSLRLCLHVTTRSPMLSWSKTVLSEVGNKATVYIQHTRTLQIEIASLPALTNLQTSIVLKHCRKNSYHINTLVRQFHKNADLHFIFGLKF